MRKEVILVDDDSILRLVVQKMIHQIDSSVICHHCENGEVGLKALQPFLNTDSSIIVILDINMPVLDGWGFLERLEHNNVNNIKNMQLFIVSSSTDESDKIKAKNYNLVKNFLHKPLYKEDFLEILGQ